ncbi:MAG: signal peptidase I [Acidimicrobiales bacterium]
MTTPLPGAGRAGQPRWTRTAKEVPLLLVSAAVLAFLLKTLVAQAFYIPSGSMLPQLQINDRVVVSKISYRLHPPRRGDIVVFDCPEKACTDRNDSGPGGLRGLLRKVAEGVGVAQPSTEEFIKRVVGLPGETVEGRDGAVHIDSRRLREPYLAPGAVTADFPPVLVPDGHLFVMGDNRANSSDSRVFGPIPESLVVGRTIARVWPLPSASFL